jgi:4-hydroxy-2-oxoheptanedioate aldolase
MMKNIKRIAVVMVSLAILWALSAVFLAGQESAPYKPKRINKVIELLEQKQPVYFTAAIGERDYEDGKKMAQTYADYIDYPLEHDPFDMSKLRRFMQGLADGGPTKSGHRTPAVIATLPVLGITEAQTRAGDWVIQQVLAAGVHGIMFCRARNAGAVRALLEAARYPFHKQGVGSGGLGEGYRGAGSQGYAARIWGLPAQQYLEKADFWPLNPNGELILALKLEDRQALENAEEVTKIPGVAYAEYGPGDMTFSLVGIRPPGAGPAPEVEQARLRIMAACRAAGIFFMGSGTTVDNVEGRLKQGEMIARADEKTADHARRLMKRAMPW